MKFIHFLLFLSIAVVIHAGSSCKAQGNNSNPLYDKIRKVLEQGQRKWLNLTRKKNPHSRFKCLNPHAPFLLSCTGPETVLVDQFIGRVANCFPGRSFFRFRDWEFHNWSWIHRRFASRSGQILLQFILGESKSSHPKLFLWFSFDFFAHWNTDALQRRDQVWKTHPRNQSAGHDERGISIVGSIRELFTRWWRRHHTFPAISKIRICRRILCMQQDYGLRWFYRTYTSIDITILLN